MKLRCLIIDDEPFARRLLLDYCSRIPEISVEADFSNALEALQFLNKHSIDFIFLDIKMPGITGIDLLNSLRHKPKVIFTTAFAEYAVDGFELDAVDYLLKPFDFPRFLKAVNKVQNLSQHKPVASEATSVAMDFIFVKDGRDLVKIQLNEILYIKGQKDYVMFMLKDKKVMSLMNMRDLEAELSSKQFIRIHQSYIVNSNHINSISNDKVKVWKEFLPISQSYKLGFKAFIEKFQ